MRVQEAQVPQASPSIGAATVHELRQRDRGGTLADAVGAREDQAGWERFPRHGTGHELEQVAVADEVTKRHGGRSLGLSAGPARASLPALFFFLPFLFLLALVLVIAAPEDCGPRSRASSSAPPP